VALPAIFDDGRVLGPLFARFAIVAYYRDDLVLVVGIYLLVGLVPAATLKPILIVSAVRIFRK